MSDELNKTEQETEQAVQPEMPEGMPEGEMPPMPPHGGRPPMPPQCSGKMPEKGDGENGCGSFPPPPPPPPPHGGRPPMPEGFEGAPEGTPEPPAAEQTD